MSIKQLMYLGVLERSLGISLTGDFEDLSESSSYWSPEIIEKILEDFTGRLYPEDPDPGIVVPEFLTGVLQHNPLDISEEPLFIYWWGRLIQLFYDKLKESFPRFIKSC